MSIPAGTPPAPDILTRAARVIRIANLSAIATSVIVAGIALMLMTGSSLGTSPLALVVLAVTAALGYRLAYEVIARILTR